MLLASKRRTLFCNKLFLKLNHDQPPDPARSQVWAVLHIVMLGPVGRNMHQVRENRPASAAPPCGVWTGEIPDWYI